MDVKDISVTVLCKNAEDTLKTTLESLHCFGEVILLDNGSTDTSLEIAASFPFVRIFHSTTTGFGALHNEATSYAKCPYILSLDSDEYLEEDAILELKKLDVQENMVYSFPRKNYYKGKWIRHCGWYPDRCLRLYNKHRTAFSSDLVHERVLTDNMRVGQLQSAIHHLSYKDLSHFLTKIDRYSSLYAKENAHKNPSVSMIVLKSTFAFFRSYFLRAGFLDGKRGFIISVAQAEHTYYKYAKILEAKL